MAHWVAWRGPETLIRWHVCQESSNGDFFTFILVYLLKCGRSFLPWMKKKKNRYHRSNRRLRVKMGTIDRADKKVGDCAFSQMTGFRACIWPRAVVSHWLFRRSHVIPKGSMRCSFPLVWKPLYGCARYSCSTLDWFFCLIVTNWKASLCSKGPLAFILCSVCIFILFFLNIEEGRMSGYQCVPTENCDLAHKDKGWGVKKIVLLHMTPCVMSRCRNMSTGISLAIR